MTGKDWLGVACAASLVIAGCADSDAPGGSADAGPGKDASAETRAHDAGPDSAMRDARVEVADAGLAHSRQTWDALVASMGDTYSYAEENCVVNAPEHTVTTVQVIHGVARLFATTQISSRQCLARVNRYDSFQPHTLPELYDTCAALLEREAGAVTVEFDQEGVLRACTWPGSNDCRDNCGEGFYLRALGFGVLEVP
jgi:hypothetical protein